MKVDREDCKREIKGSKLFGRERNLQKMFLTIAAFYIYKMIARVQMRKCRLLYEHRAENSVNSRTNVPTLEQNPTMKSLLFSPQKCRLLVNHDDRVFLHYYSFNHNHA